MAEFSRVSPNEPRKDRVELESGKEGGSKRRLNVLSHGEFYAACEHLKKHRQVFLDTRPTHTQAAKMLTEALGFAVSASTIPELKKATGVDWESRRGESIADGRRKSYDNISRVLITSVWRLYRKLGEEVQSALQELYEALSKEEVQ